MGENESKLTIPNSVLMRAPAALLKTSLMAVLDNPLPVLVRLDLAPRIRAVVERAEELERTCLELLQRYGAVEVRPGMWRLDESAPGFEEYRTEFQKMSGAVSSFEGGPVPCPARVTFMGRSIDIVVDGAGEAVLSHLIEWQR